MLLPSVMTTLVLLQKEPLRMHSLLLFQAVRMNRAVLLLLLLLLLGHRDQSLVKDTAAATVTMTTIHIHAQGLSSRSCRVCLGA